MNKRDKLVSIEIEILEELDRVCHENGLCYSLSYGSLLGAVRHKGLIPWDDDIDVMMPRDDYERLISIWDDVSDSRYILVDNKRYDDYVCNFAKIRKHGTTIIQHEYEKKRKYPKGIFVDIFPFDRRPKGKVGKVIQFVAGAVDLLFSRGFHSGYRGIIGLAETLLLAFPRTLQIIFRNKAERVKGHWNSNENLEWIGTSTIREFSITFPGDMFQSVEPMRFEGKEFMCINKYDQFLRTYYGDYLELPPEEERTGSHALIELNFDI